MSELHSSRNVSEVFDNWSRMIESSPEKWRQFPGRFLWVIEGCGSGVSNSSNAVSSTIPTEERWLCDLSGVPKGIKSTVRSDCMHGQRRTETDRETEIDCEIRLLANDFLLLVSGRLNPQIGFARRQITVRGSTKYVLRLNLLLEKLIQDSPLLFSVQETGRSRH